ncbi:shikimate dehydrogenase [Salinibacterium sp. ZJ454]|uniref:shikimate dehydrogenase n=1 Tax=Salinibacterium sp. ZJ454 TaxID=2708339 RepID=UPI00141F87CD|nr:shikimate dehydrogenase [Salinibacterium sp. ZJ454]
MTTHLAVLGSPIAHSQSPALHAAAYRTLGLDWSYEPIEVTEDTLAAFVTSRDSSWRGLSLTMPLKQQVLPLLDRVDELATLTGAANTLLYTDGGRLGFNTDVFGITEPLRSAGLDSVESGVILGAGATAASALVALSQLGADTVTVAARSPQKAFHLVDLGLRVGVRVDVRELADVAALDADVVVSTLPNGATVSLDFAERVRQSAVLFDVAYKPWPTGLATAWYQAEGTVVPGIEMLIGQALLQVRIFVQGDASTPLPDEATVHAAMRAAVGVQG